MIERFVLHDSRNNKYFGGGVVKGTFVYWIDDIKEAKWFPMESQVQNVVDRLKDWSRDTPETAIYENNLLPYADNVYQCIKVTITEETLNKRYPVKPSSGPKAGPQMVS